MKKTIFAAALFFLMGVVRGGACTNFIITKGASTDGSVMISYSADSHSSTERSINTTLPARRTPPGR